MEQVKVIERMISLVALSPEECLALVKLLIAKWKIKQEDCFVSEPKRRGRKPKVVSETDEVKEPKRRGRKPKVVSETDEVKEPKRRGRKPKAVSETDEVKEPKRRGRKPKVVSETDEVKEPKRRGRKTKAVSETDEVIEIPKTLNPDDEVLIEAAKRYRDGRKLLEDGEVIVPVTNSKKNKVFMHYSDYPELKKQTLGPKQEFELLYKWKGKLLLSHYILTEVMPIGIYVPYKSKMFGKYIGFVIYLYDEKVIQVGNEAINDAETMELVDGENWNVMDSLQWCTVKQVSERLNRLLSKVGGDVLGRTYQTRTPNSATVTGIGNIRYTVNVK